MSTIERKKDINARAMAIVYEEFYGNPEVMEARKPSRILEQIKLLEAQLKNGKEIVISRSLFADSEMGEASYREIVKGTPCQLFTTQDEDKECGKRAILMVDFDHSGDEFRIAACSLADAESIENRVKEDLRKQNTYTVFGINGFGRHKSLSGAESRLEENSI